MVQCGMLQFYTWNATEMQNVMWNMAWGGMLHNARCGKLRYGGVSGIVMKNVAYQYAAIVVRRHMRKEMQCLMWWCNVEYGVM